MAFAAADLDAVEAALLDLAAGARTVQVSVRDKMIRYADDPAAMDKLLRLRGLIMRDLGLAATRSHASMPGYRGT